MHSILDAFTALQSCKIIMPVATYGTWAAPTNVLCYCEPEVLQILLPVAPYAAEQYMILGCREFAQTYLLKWCLPVFVQYHPEQSYAIRRHEGNAPTGLNVAQGS